MNTQGILHYNILGELGRGGMGVVYKAVDTKLGRTVALKFLPDHGSVSAADRDRFLQEAQTASALNHPNICIIHAIEEADGRSFIVMEYVEGKTLREVKGTLSDRQAAEIGIQIAEGLSAAHAKGIIHRDIKPDNIMLRPDGRVAIMDFGLAKLAGVSALSKSGSTSGTTAYMAPEVLQGQGADERSDIFAFGVVMYELVSGQLPFRGAHEAAIMYEIVNVEAPSVRTVKPTVDGEIDRILSKCMEKDPSHRSQSAMELAVDLKRFTRHYGPFREALPLPDAAPRPVSPPPRSGKRISTRQVVILGGAVACVAAALFFLLPSAQRDTINSIAVLPFENMGGDNSGEYLSEGLAESIINNLTKIPDLRVVPRSTAFRMRSLDPQEAGTKLKVRSVLSGSIQRAGEDIIVQVDLIDVDKQSQLWGQQFRLSSSGLALLQSQISTDVSALLRQGLSGDVQKNVSKQYTMNPEAYKLYLHGVYFWNKRRAVEIARAIDCFTQAITLDPAYALAYVGLANCYLVQEEYAGIPGKETLPRALAAVTRALQLDNSLAEAHTSFAYTLQSRWKWDQAEEEYKRSLSLNPNYPTTYHWYSALMEALGRYDERLSLMKKGVELDPLSPLLGTNLAAGYFVLGQYDQAEKAYNAVIAIDSTFSLVYLRKSQLCISLGRNDEGYSLTQKGTALANRSSESLSFLGYASAKAGRMDEALNIARELEDRVAANASGGYYPAKVYAGIGDREKMYHWLNYDIENQSGLVMWLSSHPEWKPYANEPRFMAILQKIGLKK